MKIKITWNKLFTTNYSSNYKTILRSDVITKSSLYGWQCIPQESSGRFSGNSKRRKDGFNDNNAREKEDVMRCYGRRYG